MIVVESHYFGRMVAAAVGVGYRGRGGISLRDERRVGFWHLGSTWHNRYLPLHFSGAAFMRYGYLPRRPGYVKRKYRKYGANLPLVWSGRSRAAALARDVRGTDRSVTIVLHARALNFRHRRSAINMRDEVTRVNATERRVLFRDFEGFIKRQLEQREHEKQTFR